MTSKSQAQDLEVLFTNRKTPELKRVIIVGGGKIGFQVATRLGLRYPGLDLRLIDLDREVRELSRELDKAIIIHGDGMDEELLRNGDRRSRRFRDHHGERRTQPPDRVGKALGAKKAWRW